MIRDSPAFEQAEAVVLFGSRTHRGAGYGSLPESDLDVMLFWNAFNPDLVLERMEHLNEALKPLASKVGFKVAWEMPSLANLSESTGGTEAKGFSSFRNGLCRGAEQRRMLDLQKQVREKKWNRNRNESFTFWGAPFST